MSLDKQNKFEVYELKNLTSDQVLVARNHDIEIVYCELNTVTFQSSRFSGLLDQLVSMRGILKIHKEPPIDFTVVGKIIGLKTEKNLSQQITIKMNQYNKSDWDFFISCLKTKQQRVDHLLESIKGNE